MMTTYDNENDDDNDKDDGEEDNDDDEDDGEDNSKMLGRHRSQWRGGMRSHTCPEPTQPLPSYSPTSTISSTLCCQSAASLSCIPVGPSSSPNSTVHTVLCLSSNGVTQASLRLGGVKRNQYLHKDSERLAAGHDGICSTHGSQHQNCWIRHLSTYADPGPKQCGGCNVFEGTVLHEPWLSTMTVTDWI